MANNNLQLNLGALRSAMSLTLHTHHATRLWHGRQRSEDQQPIIGLNAFLAITNKMIKGASQDDPYSDWWMIRVEEKLDEIKSNFEHQREVLAGIFKNIPATLSIGENLNLRPVSLQIFANSPLGFLAIFLIAEYDEITRQLLLAQHVGLIDRPTLDVGLEEGAHLLRSLFALVVRYQYSGTRREDFVANNAAAQAAIEKYGRLPQEVLEGNLRSRYAPPIMRYSEHFEEASQDNEDAKSDETPAAVQSILIEDSPEPDTEVSDEQPA